MVEMDISSRQQTPVVISHSSLLSSYMLRAAVCATNKAEQRNLSGARRTTHFEFTTPNASMQVSLCLDKKADGSAA